MKLPIYLDNNATTPIDPQVLEAMLPVFKTHFGNPASKTHAYGWHAEELVQIAREQVAELIGATPEEILFTSGGTESNNLAIIGAYQSRKKHSPTLPCRFLSVVTEHKAVLDPLHNLQEEGAAVTLLPVESDGLLREDDFLSALQEKPFFVSVMLANNEIGVIQEIEKLSRLTKQERALFHTDAVQAVGRVLVDVRQLNVDLLSISAHKLYGPKGIGALYVKRGTPLKPLFFGGGHEQGLRSGSLNVPGIVGFGAACAISKEVLESEKKRLTLLSFKLLSSLQREVLGIEVNGSLEKRIPGNLNISFEGVENTKLLAEVHSKLALSISSACMSGSSAPSYVVSALGNKNRAHSSIRIGLGRFTTEEEVETAVNILAQAVKKVRGG